MKVSFMKGLIGVLLAFVVLPSVAAEIDKHVDIPPGLADILRGTTPTMCRSDADYQQADLEQPVPTLAPDLSCAIGVDAATHLLGNPRVHLIDMRKKDQFEAFHINGALNMEMTQVATKAYLRKSPLVLLGEGKGDRELYLTCAQLKQDGFKEVRVLKGGITAWVAQGQPVLGQAPGVPQLMRLAPSELLQEGNFANNVFVIAGRAAAWKRLLPSEATLPLTPKPGPALAAVIAQRQKSQLPAASIIVVGTEWRKVQQLAESLLAQKQGPVLTFAGSPDEYQKAQAVQNAIVAAKSRPPRQSRCSL